MQFFFQDMAGYSSSCYCQHACLFFFSRAATGKFSDFQLLSSQLSEFLISSCGQISKLGSGAIAISLPFSCILGLLASMTATTMGRLCILYFINRLCLDPVIWELNWFLWNLCLVNRRYVWVYAAIQFGLVVLFGHIFYSLVRDSLITDYVMAC